MHHDTAEAFSRKAMGATMPSTKSALSITAMIRRIDVFFFIRSTPEKMLYLFYHNFGYFSTKKGKKTMRKLEFF